MCEQEKKNKILEIIHKELEKILSKNRNIIDLLKDFEVEGFHVDITLLAAVILHKNNSAEKADTSNIEKNYNKLPVSVSLELNKDDKEFLRAMKIEP